MILQLKNGLRKRVSSQLYKFDFQSFKLLESDYLRQTTGLIDNFKNSKNRFISKCYQKEKILLTSPLNKS